MRNFEEILQKTLIMPESILFGLSGIFVYSFAYKVIIANKIGNSDIDFMEKL